MASRAIAAIGQNVGMRYGGRPCQSGRCGSGGGSRGEESEGYDAFT